MNTATHGAPAGAPTLAPAPGFSEQDFERLAAALDAVPAERRALFLTKLVIVLAASATAAGQPQALADALPRAARHL